MYLNEVCTLYSALIFIIIRTVLQKIYRLDLISTQNKLHTGSNKMGITRQSFLVQTATVTYKSNE